MVWHIVGWTQKAESKMTTRTRVNLVGAGNVGQTLCRLAELGGRYKIQDIFNRTEEKAQGAVAFIGSGRSVGHIGDMRPAEIWLVTTDDSQIAPVAAELARYAAGPSVAVHFSGVLTAAEMKPLGLSGWHLASAHPVFSFADPITAVQRFEGTFCAVEGDRVAISAIQAFLKTTGARIFPIQADAKLLYHGAAVIANNLTTVLQTLALEAWEEAGVPANVRAEIHADLLHNTVDNLLSLGPQASLTGPAARGDLDMVRKQQAAIANWRPAVAEIYGRLSEMAVTLKTSGRT
jgi:predicted short-subunit dehydrogenase-like oxidoreductase (DUF2520 family)